MASSKTSRSKSERCPPDIKRLYNEFLRACSSAGIKPLGKQWAKRSAVRGFIDRCGGAEVACDLIRLVCQHWPQIFDREEDDSFPSLSFICKQTPEFWRGYLEDLFWIPNEPGRKTAFGDYRDQMKDGLRERQREMLREVGERLAQQVYAPTTTEGEYRARKRREKKLALNDAAIEFSIQQLADLFCTATFNRRVSTEEAENTLRHFVGCYDRKLKGPQWSKSKDRTRFVAALERGADGDNYHYHIKLKLPEKVKPGVSAIDAAKTIWRKITRTGRFDIRTIASPDDSQRISRYMFKQGSEFIHSAEFAGG